MKGMKGRAVAKPQVSLDWHDIHRRLEAARTAIEQGESLSAEDVRQVLRARARALAQEPESAQKSESTIEVVEFVVAQETYAVESRFAREVAPISELTPVPGTPAHVLGIINVRGQLLFVIDIKRFFDLPEKGLTDLNRIVIVHSETVGFGILADQIVGARTIALDELQTSLPTLTGIREEYLKGISADRTVVLDADRLLSDRNILVHESMAQAIPLGEMPPQEFSAQEIPVPETAM